MSRCDSEGSVTRLSARTDTDTPTDAHAPPRVTSSEHRHSHLARLCAAMVVDYEAGTHHTCGLPKRHRFGHRCAFCPEVWT
jgi:hypothetical protein